MKDINSVFLVLALIAEIIGTIGGFGSSVFFVPLGNFYFDFHSVLGLTAIFHVSSNLSKIFLFKKGLDKKLLFNIGVPAVVFVIAGGLLSKFMDSSFLEIILGLFLIGFSLLFIIKSEVTIEPNKKNAIVGLERASRPGLRKYTKAKELPRVLNGLGIAVLSTSKGIVTDKEARKLNIGGEVLCYVY